MLDEAGERLMSLASRLASAPNDAYWALSTADAKFPKVTLSNGEEVTVSYGQYRAILATRHEQADREKAFTALHETYKAIAQHLRRALQRRLPARLVPGARARLQEHARSGAARRQHPHLGRREPDRDDARRRRAAAPLPPAAAPDAQGADAITSTTSRSRSSPSTRSTTTTGARLDRRGGRAARTRVPGADAPGVRQPLDRRLRERGQAFGRVLGAGVRRAPVHAAQLHRHDGRRVHDWRTRWGTRCTPSCRTRRSRSSTRTTRSSSPRCRRR